MINSGALLNSRRIHIIGGPGSGKSTLARRLAIQIDAPLYELDHIAFAGKDFSERPLPLRLARVREIARQPRWVTEGIFLGWIDELLSRADAILWLDNLPWRTAAARIVVRFAQNGWREVRRQRGRDKFTRFRDYRRNLEQLAGVMFSSRAYYADAPLPVHRDIRNVTRAETAAYLAPYASKVIHFRNPPEINDLLSSLQPGEIPNHGA